MVFFGVLSVSCRIYRSSRKKPDGCSLDPLRILSIPSPYQVLVFAGFAGFAGKGVVSCCVSVAWCVMWCVLLSLFSLYCVCISLCREEGNKILGGDKGAAPPRAQAPSPCRVGLAPQILQPLAEVIHRIQVAYNDNQLQEPSSILHRCVIAFLLLPECVKEICDAE